MNYIDERERVERVEWESESDAAALREARQIVAFRKKCVREAYRERGIRIKIRQGYYRVICVKNESADLWVFLSKN